LIGARAEVAPTLAGLTFGAKASCPALWQDRRMGPLAWRGELSGRLELIIRPSRRGSLGVRRAAVQI